MRDQIDVSTIRVREATEADIDAVHAIYAHHVASGVGSFEEVPPAPGEMRARFALVREHGFPYLVAEYAGAVKGYAYASSFRPRSAYRYTVEDSIYIAADCVGVGIGRMLLRELIDRCAALGFRQMVAVIGGAENQASIKLHASLGFQTVGLIAGSGYKFERWTDTVLMQRTLGLGCSAPPER